MKIKRDEDKKKKELTPEEKELQDLKRAKNIGLLALGTGAVSMLTSRAGRKFNDTKSVKESIERSIKENNPSLSKAIPTKDINILKYGGIGLGAVGAGVHGVSAVKYRKLKNKLKKQQEEDDNTKEEK